MTYELWDTEAANLLGDYATEADALNMVRRTARARGDSAVAPLALAFEDDVGETHPIASGEALLERAQTADSCTDLSRSRNDC